MPYAAPVDTDRFWSLVDRRDPDDCWPWTGYIEKQPGRYPRPRYTQGRKQSPTAIKDRAYRVAWFLTHGSLPPSPLVLRHTCDNSICCNPGHLVPGTHADNNRDRDERGRTARGQQTRSGKLTERDVKRIRRLHATGNYTYAELGRRVGISSGATHALVHRKNWGWVE